MDAAFDFGDSFVLRTDLDGFRAGDDWTVDETDANFLGDVIVFAGF